MNDVEKLIEREKTLLAYAGPDSVVHFMEYLKVKGEENDKVRAFMSGFKSFDEKLRGFATGEVTVISGRTGEGKTLFAESWLQRLIQNDAHAKGCFFSWEVSPFALLAKYATNESMPLYVPLALEAMNVDWLADRMQEAKIKHGCQLFVLDHLHFLVDMATKQNMSLNIGGFMRRLKRIALDLNVGVILIAHQDKGEKGQEPSLEGIRDSTFISQEADNVLIVWRRKDFTTAEIIELGEAGDKIRGRMMGFPNPTDPYTSGFAVVQIAKSRRAGTFRWPKLFQKVGHFLEEV